MPFTPEEIAKAKVRVLAKEFISIVRESNMACTVPDEIFDKVPEGMEGYFKQQLLLKLYQRKDYLWERK